MPERAELAPPMPAEIAALRDGGEPVWVFAYGSLLWDAELRDAVTELALLHGYHRSFCLLSYDYRGTAANPGLTLGLDRGGSCRGAVLRLSIEALDRIWRREMSGRLVYAARLLRVQTANGARQTLAFTALRNCPDYAGSLPLELGGAHDPCRRRPPRHLPRLFRKYHSAPGTARLRGSCASPFGRASPGIGRT